MKINNIHKRKISKVIDLWVKENTNKHKCQCGCEQYIPIIREYHWKTRNIPKYIKGHKRRNHNAGFKKGMIPWNKNKKVSSNTGRTHFKKGMTPWNKSMYGEGNANWRGGKAKEKYPASWNLKLKREIRDRDNHRCRLCGKSEKELQGFHKYLDVHHIDYNKENCAKNNLISLCRKCHVNTNFNRDYWYAYCKYILENEVN